MENYDKLLNRFIFMALGQKFTEVDAEILATNAVFYIIEKGKLDTYHSEQFLFFVFLKAIERVYNGQEVYRCDLNNETVLTEAEAKLQEQREFSKTYYDEEITDERLLKIINNPKVPELKKQALDLIIQHNYTLDEVAEELGMSKSALKHGLKALQKYNCVDNGLFTKPDDYAPGTRYMQVLKSKNKARKVQNKIDNEQMMLF